jgi:hypothetical protein
MASVRPFPISTNLPAQHTPITSEGQVYLLSPCAGLAPLHPDANAHFLGQLSLPSAKTPTPHKERQP